RSQYRFARLDFGQQFCGCPRAKGKTAQIIVRKIQMIDQRQDILYQPIVRISGFLMRSLAFTMGAQVRHDDAKTGICQKRGLAKFDPVGIGIGKQAVEQDDSALSVRLSGVFLTHFMYFQLHAIKRRKIPFACFHYFFLKSLRRSTRSNSLSLILQKSKFTKFTPRNLYFPPFPTKNVGSLLEIFRHRKTAGTSEGHRKSVTCE